MKIGVNGRFLVAKRTGVQRAAYNLLRNLVAIDRENEYFIFTGQNQLGNSDWDYPNVQVIPSRLRGGESFRNHMWEQFILPRLAKKHNIDILHSPANMAPLFYSGKTVVHIHDLCFVVNPHWYSFMFHTLYNFVIPRLAQRASKVITNSNNSRNDLLQFCNVSADRVSLIYWAVDNTFMNSFQEKIEIKDWPYDDYILYVGSLEPRKNIRQLIEAYEELRHKNANIKSKLILIGGESPLFGEVQLNVKTYKSDIIFKGFVDDIMLREFYRRAKLVVYPSLYEGFGLPPLEAMASGTPVVTSNTSSIPEVVGDAALMVSPYDTKQLASTMERVLTDDELHAKLVRNGYQQIKKFNWLRVARNTLAVYYEVYYSESHKKLEHLPVQKWRELRALENEHLEMLGSSAN